MAEKQEAAAMFGVDASKTVGDISSAMGWQEGSLPKVLLHGAVGAATSRLGGGNPGVGALVGAANELAIPTMDQLAQQAGFTKGSAAYENALRLGSLALGGAVGGLIGGDALSSGGIATTATENNYLKHAELLQYGQALDKCRNDKDAKACEAVNRWERLSRQRDEALLVACVSKVNAQRCEALKEEAKAADREYVAAFGDKLGEYLGKDVGYSKVTPGEVYFNHSPSAALRDVAVSKGLVAQINREKNDEKLSPQARQAANGLTYQILNSDELTLEDKAVALGELRNDLRAINGIRRDDTGIFGRYGAAAQLNLEASDGDLRTYLQTSTSLKERFSAALDGAGGAGTVATAAVGGAAEHVTNVALGKAAVAIGSISKKLGKAEPYEPMKARENVEAMADTNFPGAKVVSNTVVRKPYQRANDGKDLKVVRDASGGKAVIIDYKDPTNNQTVRANVPYDRRGYPIFDNYAAFTTNMNKDASYRGQMEEASRDLGVAIGRGQISSNLFNQPGAMAAIRAGRDRIPGWTWHHDAITGSMQLVPSDLHSRVKHIGSESTHSNAR